ncbi:hypothetical protein AYL99_06257 [Fonsecaea erecta]|uniref:Uncharacterized protein n=1 Tax=Fonsecaea erecta TaxID=1367422 RepID=A0A178ZGP5_9EURO|nr:hypothetical protein AYL99_06257 [Fonsecaea erecta]OAP58960.1 hypothetical protein AYL99_06257 [Fonsecaea erecta]
MTPPAPSITELMNMVKASIRSYRAKQQAAGGSVPDRVSPLSLIKMATATEEDIEYTARTADQEVDTVAICPTHPDYMVVGTYSLLKKDEPGDYTGQTRRGSLQVMTVVSRFRPRYAGMLPPSLDRVDFPCAVLDMHFHPADSTLLGVATSNAAVHFFRFIAHGDVLGRRVITKLLPLGFVVVAQNDEHGLVPLVTQFTWFPETRTHGVVGISDVIDVGFAATTSFGDTKVVKVSVPAIKDLFDQRADQSLLRQLTPSLNEVVHKHELEAWTVAVVDFGAASLSAGAADETWSSSSSSSSNARVILSGGDDSALIASSISQTCTATHPAGLTSTSLSSDDTTPFNAMPLWKDRRSHTAGVVAILPLSPVRLRAGYDADTRKDIVPVVTGSYDEFIRVFEIDTKTYRASFKTELRLDGGVWRLKVLDQYYSTTRRSEAGQDQGQGQGHAYSHHHTLILASLMHAGAAIVRVTRAASAAAAATMSGSSSPAAAGGGGGGDTWTITPVTFFRGSHESMVYCCDARLDSHGGGGSSSGGGQYQQVRKQARGGRDEEDGDEEDADARDGGSSAQDAQKAPPVYTVVSTSFYDMKICTWKFVDEFKVQNQ